MQIQINDKACEILYAQGFHHEFIEHFLRPLENTTQESRNTWSWQGNTYHVVGDCALVPEESIKFLPKSYYTGSESLSPPLLYCPEHKLNTKEDCETCKKAWSTAKGWPRKPDKTSTPIIPLN